MTGDVTISSSGVTTIGPGTVTANKIANNAITSTQIASSTITGGNIANSTIGVANLNASGTASSSTYLRGDGTWSTPSGGSSNTYSTGSLSTGTISSAATTVFYTVADGNTITLPASPVSGQHLILIDPDCSESNSGFTLKSNTSQSLFLFTSSGDLIPGTSVTIFCNAEMVYEAAAAFTLVQPYRGVPHNDYTRSDRSGAALTPAGAAGCPGTDSGRPAGDAAKSGAASERHLPRCLWRRQNRFRLESGL